MKYKHHSVEFEIPDLWLQEVGMNDFKPRFDCHPADLSKSMDQKIIVIDVESIEPLIERARRKGVFCDSDESGESAKERVARILRLLKLGQEMEPVEVASSENDGYDFKLMHGSHRFHCSVAMGYKKVCATFRSWS